VAGVIGRRRFLYDLWGDTVNMASRMESHGVPGRVHITRATWERVRGDFRCEARGEVEVKGKGRVETWHLVGRHGDRAAV
jgi:class 3 adenylate cyclase